MEVSALLFFYSSTKSVIYWRFSSQTEDRLTDGWFGEDEEKGKKKIYWRIFCVASLVRTALCDAYTPRSNAFAVQQTRRMAAVFYILLPPTPHCCKVKWMLPRWFLRHWRNTASKYLTTITLLFELTNFEFCNDFFEI